MSEINLTVRLVGNIHRTQDYVSYEDDKIHILNVLHTHKQTNTHTHTHIYTHTNTYTYTQLKKIGSNITYFLKVSLEHYWENLLVCRFILFILQTCNISIIIF